MDELDTTTAANRGSNNDVQQSNFISIDSNQQRARILTHLQLSPLTTLQAREELDIMHPAARVQELREQGYNIVTYRTTSDTGKGTHRVARYVLLVETGS